MLRPKPPKELGFDGAGEGLDQLLLAAVLPEEERPNPPEDWGLLGEELNERWLCVGLSRARAFAAVCVALGEGSGAIFGVAEELTGTPAVRWRMSRW